MDKAGDKNAVLDSRLRLRGAKNLRVVDASPNTRLIRGPTQMVAYGIGESLAEMIKADAKSAYTRTGEPIFRITTESRPHREFARRDSPNARFGSSVNDALAALAVRLLSSQSSMCRWSCSKDQSVVVLVV